MEITASYKRKINHELYGGMSYESSEYFCSANQEVEDGIDLHGVQKAWKELQAFCKDEVDKEAADALTGLSGGMPRLDFNKALDNYLQGKAIGTAEDYEQMSPHQQSIIQAIKRSKKRTK